MQPDSPVRLYNPARRGPGRPSERWRKWKEQTDLTEYEARWQQMEADGERVHVEADFIERFLAGSEVKRVLDAGCGTGRVAVELARRGHDVVGVDNDPDMLERAKKKSDDVTWMFADLSSVRFDRPFDAIVMAGSVPVYVEPSRRHLIVPNLARALVNGGYLITGTEFAPAFHLEGYDLWCEGAKLRLVERYGSWDGDEFVEGGDFALSVHAAYDS